MGHQQTYTSYRYSSVLSSILDLCIPRSPIYENMILYLGICANMFVSVPYIMLYYIILYYIILYIILYYIRITQTLMLVMEPSRWLGPTPVGIGIYQVRFLRIDPRIDPPKEEYRTYKYGYIFQKQ